jgi:hypothetical protein
VAGYLESLGYHATGGFIAREVYANKMFSEALLTFSLL